MKCRYSLAALPRGVCPECGQEFDPGDAATFYVPRMFMLSAGWSRAPDGGHFAVALVAFVLAMRAFWKPWTEEGYWKVGLALWIGLGAMVVPRCILRLVPQARHRLRVPRARFWKRVMYLLAIPAIGVNLVRMEVPLKLNWLMSERALIRAADDLRASAFNVHDVAGKYPESLGMQAVFRLDVGEAIEIGPRPRESWWQPQFRAGRPTIIARLRSPAAKVRAFNGRILMARPFHGQWYELRWEDEW